jgi:preprotein translocase subunit SecF
MAHLENPSGEPNDNIASPGSLENQAPARTVVAWVVSPGLLLVAWSFVSFMLWQGETSNLTTHSRPAFHQYLSIMATCAPLSFIGGAVSGALARRGGLLLVLGLLLFCALVVLVYWGFGLAATG